MKQTKEQITKIAIKVMQDIKWTYDMDSSPQPLFTSVEEQYEKYKGFEGFEENKHKIYAYWVIAFDFPKEDGWGERNTMFLKIRDDNGEPYEISHRQWKGKIIKNADGKYEKQNY